MGARAPAPVGPLVEVGQLHAQDRRLQLVQARVVADPLVADLVVGAVEAERAGRLCDLRVRGGDDAAVAERPEVLGGEEGEGGRGSERAGAPVGAAGAGRLGGVLEHRDPECLDLGDRGDVPEQVHGDDGLRAGAEHGLHRLGRDAVRVGVDVAEHRRRAGRGDRLRGGVEGEGGDDHLVAGPHAHRPQRDRDRVRAVGHADGVLAAAVGGELVLERLHLRAEDEAPGVHHAGDGLAQLHRAAAPAAWPCRTAGRPASPQPSGAPEQLEIGPGHEADQLLEARLGLPAEVALGLGGVADEVVHLGRAHERGVDLDVLLVVAETGLVEGDFAALSVPS